MLTNIVAVVGALLHACMAVEATSKPCQLPVQQQQLAISEST